MKKRKSSPYAGVLALLGVFAVLLGVAFWQGSELAKPQPTPTPQVDSRDLNTVFTGWTSEQVQALRLDDPRSPLDLTLARREDGTWAFTTLDLDVDQTIANQLAKTVTYLPYTDIFANVPADEYANFGLTERDVWMLVQVVLADGQQHAVAVGRRAPVTGGGYYALVDELPNVYVLNRGAVDYLGIYLQQFQGAASALTPAP